MSGVHWKFTAKAEEIVLAWAAYDATIGENDDPEVSLPDYLATIIAVALAEADKAGYERGMEKAAEIVALRFGPFDLALAEAVADERRETMKLLGCDVDGEWMPSREVERSGLTVAVSDDAYYNLEGVLHDLKRQEADKVCIRTIERVQAQIAAVVKRSRGDGE